MIEKESNEFYAVKAFLKEDFQGNKSKVDSLKSEIRISKQLNHKNIVKFKELHETKRSVYLIYEYLAGPSILDASIQQDLKMEEITEIMFSLLEGAQYLKENCIVHRDLKPSNIHFKLNNDFSSLKILDFGLSCNKHDSSSSFKICGTPGYIAPESFTVDSSTGWKILDSPLDVFSIGVIFHFLLFGRLVYGAGCNKGEQAYLKNKEGTFELGKFEELKDNFKSAEAYDLMRRMLIPNCSARITIKDALKHRFFVLEKRENIFFLDNLEGEIMRNRDLVLKESLPLSGFGVSYFPRNEEILEKKQPCIVEIEKDDHYQVSSIFSTKEISSLRRLSQSSVVAVKGT